LPDPTAERIVLGLAGYLVLLFSLSFHESAHGWMAHKMGDDTAKLEGRVSLNPFVHIDPIGTFVIPMIQIFGPQGIPLLGWAKPTPVGAHNFRKLAEGHVRVAAAGPLSNVILALAFTMILFAARQMGFARSEADLSLLMLFWGIQLNVALALFNLVPIPPLDGSWVVSWGLPRSVANRYDRIVEPLGGWLLLILFVPIGWVLRPVSGAITALLISVIR
jgi:Zn-dependent protease